MKVRVTHAFIDKNTKELNQVGSIIDVTKARLTELKAAGDFVVVVKDQPADEQPAETTPAE